MPQLNPSPWFYIIVISWLMFLLVVVPITLSHTTPNSPASKNVQPAQTPSWYWQWV